MLKTLERAAEADLFLLVFAADQRAPVLPPELKGLAEASNSIIIFNKSDLSEFSSSENHFPGFPALPVSALTGAGLDALTVAITRFADSFQKDTGDDLIAINARHAHALGQAQESLAAARVKLRDGTAVELLASDLRGVLAAYGAISGQVDNERMLDALFATFCIGK
jgi:tRNA modification GTPase